MTKIITTNINLEEEIRTIKALEVSFKTDEIGLLMVGQIVRLF